MRSRSARLLNAHKSIFVYVTMAETKARIANEKVTVMAPMPSMSRSFPKELDITLPLRNSMRQYKVNMGRVLTSNDSPESDGDGLSDGRMFTMAAFPPIVGHAVVINDYLCVCESMYANVNETEMEDVVSKLVVNGLKWLVGPDPNDVYPIPVTDMPLLSRASEVYINGGPLCAYDNHAVIESANHSSHSSFWQSLYPPLEDVECHYGAIGLMHDNSTISLGVAVGNENDPNIEERIPKKEHSGFLDACYTPSSKAAGKVRTLAFSVQKRVRTIRSIRMACEILSVLRQPTGMMPREWVVRCEGICTTVTEKAVVMMVDKWKRMSEINMPVLHVFRSKKVIVISIAQGVLIRPVRWKVVKSRSRGSYEVEYEGPYVDTTAVYGSDTMAVAKLFFPKPKTEPEQFFSTIALTIPFAAWTADPRLNLGVQMIRQGLSTTPVKGDATMVAMGENKPLVTTPFAQMLTQRSTTEIPIVIPGKNVVTAFINRTLNTEDACTVSKELAESGFFSWSGYIDYPLPRSDEHFRVGMVVKDQYWWAPGIEGTVVDIRMSKVGDPIAVVYVASKELRVGDKLGTAHGIKFTVGEIIPYTEMPSIIEESTGKEFKPNLLISTKNLTRGLGGQLREMVAATSMFESIEAFRTKEMVKTKHPMVVSFEDQKKVEARLPNGYVVVNGKRLSIKDTNGSTREIKATYGIMRVMQLRHMSSLKHHYPSTTFNSITVPRGRYRLGTPRLSEGELMAIIMQNCSAAVRDALITDNLVVFTSCSKCHATTIACDCPFPKPPSIEKQTRYSLLVLTTFVEVATMNDPSGPAISLRFMTRT